VKNLWRKVSKRGIEKSKAGFVKNLLAANKFTDAEIANFADVTEEYVRKVAKE